MASVAFLSDRLTLARCVRAVMTTETSWKIHVAQVVRISAPSNLQLRENVAVVDRKNSVTSLTNIFRSICVQIGVVLLIKANEPGRYFRGRLCACRIVCLQQLQALPLDVGQGHRDISEGERPIQRSLWQVEGMRRAIMAVHTFHVELRKCLGRI